MKKLSLRDSIIAGIVLLLVLAAGYVWLSPSGVKAPEFSANALNMQRKIDLKELRGRPVLVTFWATSCPGCVQEMPHLIELYRELAPKGLEIVGVAMSYDRPDHVLEMAKRKGIPYPLVYDGTKSYSEAFGGVSLTPTSFLISPDGQIVKQKIGEMDMELLHAQIITMLNRKKDT